MMNHWRITTLALMALCLIGSTSAEALRLHSRIGDVVFNHDEHKMFVECQVCHHKKQEGCANCHLKSNAIGRSRIFHSLCRSCHAQKNAGPTQCDQCHVPCTHKELGDC